jgi:hypothetical protein
VGAKAEKIFALALSRVVVRNMAGGVSVEYEQLLLETAAEVEVLLDRRRGRRLEREARLACRMQELIREAQVQHAAVAQTRPVSPDDVELDLRCLDLALGPLSSLPKWHPDYPQNDS